MSDRLSRNSIRKILIDCEPELRECFDVVSAMVHGGATNPTGADLLGFQPKLLKVIQKLEGSYREIKREQSRLIAGKANYQLAWFKGRMATLSSYAKAITEALAICRAIGDGFAWFWYERDPKLIDQHLKQQRQPFLPSGVGGLGEQLTLERLQGFDQKLILYHGLTSFLRLGDVSFIDMTSARVAYIAEIKTKREDEQTCLLFAGRPSQRLFGAYSSGK